jgi:hypothetical protein
VVVLVLPVVAGVSVVVLMRPIAAAVMMHPARLMRRRRVRLGVLAGGSNVEGAAGAESR